MDCEEGLRTVAYLRRSANEDERNGRPRSAKALRDVALAMECVDYGVYLFEYKYGIKLCND